MRVHDDVRAETLADLYPAEAARLREREAADAAAAQDAAVAAVAAREWTGDGTPYGVAALRGILSDLSTDAAAGRNNALTRAAFRLARLVAGGELRHESTVAALRDAGNLMRLPAHETRHIIAGAYRRGLTHPKAAPPRRRAA